MSKAGRKGNAKARYRAEVELIAKYGAMSSRVLAEKLQAEYGLSVSHAQVNLDLKEDIEALSEAELDKKKTGLLGELEDMIQAARNISQTDPNNNTRLKAMGTYNSLVKTQAEILKTFEEVKLKSREAERPIYDVTIGKPDIKEKVVKKDD